MGHLLELVKQLELMYKSTAVWRVALSGKHLLVDGGKDGAGCGAGCDVGANVGLGLGVGDEVLQTQHAMFAVNPACVNIFPS